MLRSSTLAATIMLALVTCESTASEAQRFRFCPPSEEEDARTMLGLGSADEIGLDKLLRRLDALRLMYETPLADNVVRKCENVEAVPNARSIKVYTGVDVSGDFSRNYLVVADESGAVRYIEARHAYRAP